MTDPSGKGMDEEARLQRIDELLHLWGEWRGSGSTTTPAGGRMQSTLGRLVTRSECSLCLGRGRVNAVLAKGGIGRTQCPQCAGTGRVLDTDRRVSPALIPGTGCAPVPELLIDVDRAVEALPESDRNLIIEHYIPTPWYTMAQHARKLGVSLRTYERRLLEVRRRLASVLWPRRGA